MTNFGEPKSFSRSLQRVLNAGLALGIGSAITVVSFRAPVLAASEESPGPDCVMTIRAQGGPLVECFDDFTAALAHATRGEITDAPMTAAAAVRDPEIRHELRIDAQFELANHENTTSGSGQILPIEYEHRDLQGNSLIYRAGSGCDADTGIEWSVPAISSDWNDEISSFVGANGCGAKHFEHSSYNGASTPWGQSGNYLGDAMNDRTSSIRWR